MNEELAKLLKEARKIMHSSSSFRVMHKDFLQRSADALKKYERQKVQK